MNLIAHWGIRILLGINAQCTSQKPEALQLALVSVATGEYGHCCCCRFVGLQPASVTALGWFLAPLGSVGLPPPPAASYRSIFFTAKNHLLLLSIKRSFSPCLLQMYTHLGDFSDFVGCSRIPNSIQKKFRYTWSGH